VKLGLNDVREMAGLGQTPAASSASWLESLISGGAATAEQIAVAQNLPTGVYTSTGPGGASTTYVQPAGSTQNIFSASQTGVTGTLGTTATGTLSGSGGMILMAGAAILLVFMMTQRGKS
jgi:hypothetical protein